MNPRVGITVGEPCGIGPELVVRVLAKPEFVDYPMRIYGSPKLLEQVARDLRVSSVLTSGRVEMTPTGPDRERFAPEDQSARGQASISAIDQAIEDAKAGRIDSMVTAPIDKSVVRAVFPNFTGHTGYLAERTGVPKTLMMLDNTELRVVLMTEHIPLRDVPGALTPEAVESTVRLAASSLKTQFGVTHPRIAVVGLNPHAGEITDRAEENTILKPVIRKLSVEGFSIEGPFPADSFFAMARNAGWDFILSLYHDQGLIPAKYAGLDKVVNITLGLPFLRISPGHGTAYDLVGRGIADTRSFERALRIATTGKLSK